MDNQVFEEKVLKKVISNIPIGLVVSREGRRRKIYYVNRAAYQMMGYTREEFIDMLKSGWNSFMDVDLREIIHKNQDKIKKGEAFDVTANTRTKDGIPKWFLYRIVVELEEEPVCYISMMDVTERVAEEQVRKKEQESLRERALRDSLTKLFNRGTMEELVNNAIENAVPGADYAYLTMDVDNFKQINDIYGHAVGDLLILELSALLTGIFGEESFVGRMGGDEFAVFMKRIKSRQEVLKQAGEVLKQLREKKSMMGLSQDPTVSIGIAFYPNDGKSFESLYHRADQALYQVKKENKNGIAVFSAD